MQERREEVAGDRYRSLKVTARAKQKLDLIASALQKPLTQVVEEMADEWWDQVVERRLLPSAALVGQIGE